MKNRLLFFSKILSIKFIRNYVLYIIYVFVLIVSVLCFYFLILGTPLKISTDRKVVEIPGGATLSQVTEILKDQEIIDNKRTFMLATALLFKGKALKAGNFDLSSVNNYRNLINKLSSSENHSRRIIIPEGYQSREIARLLARNLYFSYDDFMNKVNNESLAKRLGVDAPVLEGYLFPDTYDFNENDSPELVIRRMVSNFFMIVNDSIRKSIEISGRTLSEILTLASIIEGECIIDEERPVVASVYLNRLQKGMRLEADPTIQFIIPDGPRRLLKNDLYIRSPYNTYRNRGLPPGPIGNPGLKSIIAAVWPEDTNYLYMVAKGDGSHAFTNDYNDFLRAKRRFQRLRRQVAMRNKVNNN